MYISFNISFGHPNIFESTTELLIPHLRIVRWTSRIDFFVWPSAFKHLGDEYIVNILVGHLVNTSFILWAQNTTDFVWGIFVTALKDVRHWFSMRENSSMFVYEWRIKLFTILPLYIYFLLMENFEMSPFITATFVCTLSMKVFFINAGYR